MKTALLPARRHITIAAAILCAAHTAAADQFDGFAPHVEYAIDSGVQAMAAGDLTGNGAADLVVVRWTGSDGEAQVLLNDGSGTLALSESFSLGLCFGWGCMSRSIALADIDGNGTLDLVASMLESGLIRVWSGNGDGTFTAPATTTDINNETGWNDALVVGDLNQNGIPDVALTAPVDWRTFAVFGQGDGAFADADLLPVGTCDHTGMALLDIFGSGAPDIIVACKLTLDDEHSYLRIFPNNGSGSFGSPTMLPMIQMIISPTIVIPSTGAPGGVTAARVASATPLLRVVAATNRDTDTVTIHRFLNSNVTPYLFPVGTEPVGITAGQLHVTDPGTWVTDLVVANRGDDTVTVLEMIFGRTRTFAVGSQPTAVAIADFSGNGVNDVAVLNSGSGSVSILMNLTPPPPVPGDLNGDGVVDLADLLILLATWGPCADPGDCPADFDMNGEVDLADLLFLLGAWS